MRPPICRFCNQTFSPSAATNQAGAEKGGLLQFSDYTPLPEGMVGHPKGLEWFCGKHLEAARSLTALTTQEALRTLQQTAD